MRLHENLQDFETLVRLVSQDLGIREVYIEKDYWLTFLLKRLSEQPNANEIVFKGGTSLSKGYRIIRRFSEDIDLAVLRGSKNNSQTERFIKKIASALTEQPFEEIHEEGKTSKKGMIRRTFHRYPRLLNNTNFGPVQDSLLLEINCFSEPSPSKKMPIESFISEYLKRRGQQGYIQEYLLLPFSIQVLDYRKTFVEKILSLAYASFTDKDQTPRELRARIRHFYDLAQLFSQKEVSSFLESPDFSIWTQEVRREENLPDRTRWIKKKLHEAPLFQKTETTLGRIKRFFKSDLEPLVFKPEDLPPFINVEQTFKAITASISKFDL